MISVCDLLYLYLYIINWKINVEIIDEYTYNVTAQHSRRAAVTESSDCSLCCSAGTSACFARLLRRGVDGYVRAGVPVTCPAYHFIPAGCCCYLRCYIPAHMPIPAPPPRPTSTRPWHAHMRHDDMTLALFFSLFGFVYCLVVARGRQHVSIAGRPAPAHGITARTSRHITHATHGSGSHRTATNITTRKPQPWEPPSPSWPLPHRVPGGIGASASGHIRTRAGL